MSAIAPGFSAPAATGTARNGGGNLSSTLRMYDYDYVLSIEHEDSIMSPEEGLTRAASFLNGIVPKEKPAAAWWV